MKRLGAIVFNVVLIHAAGLVLLNQPRPSPGAGRAPAAQVVHLHLAQAPQTPPHEPTNRPQAPSSTAHARADTPPPNTEEVTPQHSAPLAEPTVPLVAAAFTPAEISDLLAGLDANTEATPSTDEYIPRPRLTSPPKATSPVAVPFPAQFDTQGRFTTVLALFIDEAGVVRRVRVEGPALPQPMEDAATQTFLQTHFQPGEVQGQVVKSLVRVEVVFDNTPIEPEHVARSM
ncbi:MAG: hypothetical protein KGL90_08010 [Burkholderiales bacterium]|nr:hypothetical protein [Burkholderiales bacterium]